MAKAERKSNPFGWILLGALVGAIATAGVLLLASSMNFDRGYEEGPAEIRTAADDAASAAAARPAPVAVAPKPEAPPPAAVVPRLMGHAHQGVQLFFEVFDTLGLSDDRRSRSRRRSSTRSAIWALRDRASRYGARRRGGGQVSFVHLHDLKTHRPGRRGRPGRSLAYDFGAAMAGRLWALALFCPCAAGRQRDQAAALQVAAPARGRVRHELGDELLQARRHADLRLLHVDVERARQRILAAGDRRAVGFTPLIAAPLMRRRSLPGTNSRTRPGRSGSSRWCRRWRCRSRRRQPSRRRCASARRLGLEGLLVAAFRLGQGRELGGAAFHGQLDKGVTGARGGRRAVDQDAGLRQAGADLVPGLVGVLDQLAAAQLWSARPRYSCSSLKL
jgi:hypothetical protein